MPARWPSASTPAASCATRAATCCAWAPPPTSPTRSSTPRSPPSARSCGSGEPLTNDQESPAHRPLAGLHAVEVDARAQPVPPAVAVVEHVLVLAGQHLGLVGERADDAAAHVEH